MSLFEELEPIILLNRLTDPLINQVSASMSTARCAAEAADDCRDDAAALQLKLIAICTILIAGVAGVALPLVGKKRRFLRTDGGLFVFAKAFAAGVILATGFVHMLHDGQSALTDPCLPEFPWKRFPFSGFVAMLASLLTLVVDFLGTQFYERKHREEENGVRAVVAAAVAADEEEQGFTIVPVESEVHEAEVSRKPGDAMHIVGMHAHAEAHRHSHPHGQGTCTGGDRHQHSHGHAHEDSEVSSHVRHVVVSQDLSAIMHASVLIIQS